MSSRESTHRHTIDMVCNKEVITPDCGYTRVTSVLWRHRGPLLQWSRTQTPTSMGFSSWS